ncbi:hypothetical protein CNEO4_240082 [Clostridium neonatale]|nr:hypothetical protein CNEO4_240082 [Clostridium neonatale]
MQKYLLIKCLDISIKIVIIVKCLDISIKIVIIVKYYKIMGEGYEKRICRKLERKIVRLCG